MGPGCTIQAPLLFFMDTVQITPSSLDLPHEWRGEVLLDKLRDAAKEWSSPRVACTGLSIEVLPAKPFRSATEDGINLVVVRTAEWCHNAVCDRTGVFPWQAMGMTTSYSPKGPPGTASEADIEINGRFIRFTDMPRVQRSFAESEGNDASLHAVLVHEIGHLLGFPDACGAHGQKCAEPLKHATVMHAADQLTELTPTDQAALCARFPQSKAAEPVTANAAATNPLPKSAPEEKESSFEFLIVLAALALALGVIALARRRAR